jgi:excisionase family DNA binding protein
LPGLSDQNRRIDDKFPNVAIGERQRNVRAKANFLRQAGCDDRQKPFWVPSRGMAMSILERKRIVADGAVGVPEACRLLALKKTFIYALMDRGELRYAKIGRRRVIPRAEITRFLADNLVGA